MEFNETEIREHALRHVTAAPISEAPFPYLFVDRVFPDEFYSHIRGLLPRRDSFDPYFANRPREDNQSFTLRRERLCADDPSGVWRIFWNSLDAVGNRLKTRFEALFPAVVRILFPDDWGSRISAIETRSIVAEMTDAGPSYTSSPHLDAPNDVFTWLFHLPEDDRFRDCGTHLYRADIDPARGFDPCDAYFRQFNDRITYVTEARTPYLPNSLLGFLNSPLSFHGYPGNKDLERRLFILSYGTLTPASFQGVFRGLDQRYARLSRLGGDYRLDDTAAG